MYALHQRVSQYAKETISHNFKNMPWLFVTHKNHQDLTWDSCNKLDKSVAFNWVPPQDLNPNRGVWNLSLITTKRKNIIPGDSICYLFGMVKTWPFQGVKWPPTKKWKGHFESPGPWKLPRVCFYHLQTCSNDAWVSKMKVGKIRSSSLKTRGGFPEKPKQFKGDSEVPKFLNISHKEGFDKIGC